MPTNTKSLPLSTVQNPETEASVQARLAQIAAAVESAQRAAGPTPEAAKNKAFAVCPVDPAERALCDSCQ